MRMTVGVLDEVSEYGLRLAKAINTRANYRLNAVYLGSPSEVSSAISEDRVQMLLVSEKYLENTEDAKLPVYLLVQDLDLRSDSFPEDRVVSRYSTVTDIINTLLSETLSETKTEESGIFTVFSPDSVSRSYRYASELAESLSRSEKTVFLPFDCFLPSDNLKSITELLYAGIGDEGNANDLLTLPKGARLLKFGGPGHFSDLWQYSGDRVDHLLEILKNNGFKNIVFHIGFMSDAVFLLMERSDAIYLLQEEDSVRGKELYRQLHMSSHNALAEKVREVI